MDQLAHVAGQSLVRTDHMVAERLAEAPVRILHRVALQDVVGRVEAGLKFIAGVVEILFYVVSLHILLQEIITSRQGHRTQRKRQ